MSRLTIQPITSFGSIRPLVWACIVAGTAYAIVAGGGSAYFGLQFTPYRIVSLGLLCVAMAIWLAAATRNDFWRPRSRLFWGLVAGTSALVVALVGSAEPRLGLDYLAYAVLLVASYLILHRLFAHPWFGHRIGSLTVVLSLVTSLGYLAAVISDWIRFWSLLGRFAIPPLRPFDYLRLRPLWLRIQICRPTCLRSVLSRRVLATRGMPSPTYRRALRSTTTRSLGWILPASSLIQGTPTVSGRLFIRRCVLATSSPRWRLP